MFPGRSLYKRTQFKQKVRKVWGPQHTVDLAVAFTLPTASTTMKDSFYLEDHVVLRARGIWHEPMS
jgi:hypothetical protein